MSQIPIEDAVEILETEGYEIPSYPEGITLEVPDTFTPKELYEIVIKISKRLKEKKELTKATGDGKLIGRAFFRNSKDIAYLYENPDKTYTVKLNGKTLPHWEDVDYSTAREYFAVRLPLFSYLDIPDLHSEIPEGFRVRTDVKFDEQLDRFRWHPEKGDLFYSPYNGKVYEYLEWAGELDGSISPDGFAHVKELDTGEDFWTQNMEVREMIPIERI